MRWTPLLSPLHPWASFKWFWVDPIMDTISNDWRKIQKIHISNGCPDHVLIPCFVHAVLLAWSYNMPRCNPSCYKLLTFWTWDVHDLVDSTLSFDIAIVVILFTYSFVRSQRAATLSDQTSCSETRWHCTCKQFNSFSFVQLYRVSVCVWGPLGGRGGRRALQSKTVYNFL